MRIDMSRPDVLYAAVWLLAIALLQRIARALGLEALEGSRHTLVVGRAMAAHLVHEDHDPPRAAFGWQLGDALLQPLQQLEAAATPDPAAAGLASAAPAAAAAATDAPEAHFSVWLAVVKV